MIRKIVNLFKPKVWVVKISLGKSIVNFSPIQGFHKEAGQLGEVLKKYMDLQIEECSNEGCDDWVRLFTLDDHTYCILCAKGTMIILGKQRSSYKDFWKVINKRSSELKDREVRIWGESILEMVGYYK